MAYTIYYSFNKNVMNCCISASQQMRCNISCCSSESESFIAIVAIKH